MSVSHSYGRQLAVKNSGYDTNYQGYYGVFYTFACHSSCETCEGPLPGQCLTCPTALISFNGLCACPAATIANNSTHFLCQPHGCAIFNASGVCTACEQTLYRVKVPDPYNLCPCIAGAYENASSKCVRCPLAKHCAICQLSGGIVICLTCSAAQHRVLSAGVCNCIVGYQERNKVDATSYFCVRAL